MTKKWQVKITVAKRLFNKDLVDECGSGNWAPCSRLQDGQEFFSDGEIPDGFCGWAWNDIIKYVVTLARGGNFINSKKGYTVASCSDGYRPVIFKLERMGHKNL
ncbi:MAG: TIGR04076 family protein [Victivallaceae bacterium]|nr:TIGR04076 family protein [Victivallaceae bacterium]